ncbi:MAG: DUF2235 domain-containing protein [Sphingomonas sp.]
MSQTEKANPKRLVIFCDGTWNSLRMPDLTNVARLAKCVQPTGTMLVEGKERTVAQVVYYDEGVGVGEDVGKFTNFLVKIFGGALGRGLNAKIEKAYRFIVLNYDPDDEIHIFGFSRGAYTARSLCGLIRKAGIMRRSEFENIGKAIDLYRSAIAPYHADAQTFRRQYSHPIVAGSEDYTDKDLQDIEAFRKEVKAADEVRIIPPEIRARGAHIRYLGIWDTVGALGVPKRLHLLSGWFNKGYRFHDEDASTLIESLRHAVSLDEKRATFDATRVNNVTDLNIMWAAAVKDKQVSDRDAPGYVPYVERPYQQRWFPGDHGAIGGGNPELGLSSAALLWIAEGAEQVGLALAEVSGADRGLAINRSPGSELSRALDRAEPGASWRNDEKGNPIPPGKFSFKSWVKSLVHGVIDRKGPDTLAEIHESARERWRRDPTYRPSGMHRFKGRPELEPVDNFDEEDGVND